MIAISARLAVAWVDPLALLIDHQTHGIGIDVDHLQRLADRLKAEPDATTDPIVCQRRKGRLWVENGRHRVLAHLLAGRATCAAVIVEE